MSAFQPLINLLVLLSALSLASERLANAMKLGDTDLREKKESPQGEKARERRIALRALAASVALAVFMKADFFEILSHLEAPWDTLGWVRPAEDQWTMSLFLQSFTGTIVTGISLAFGSKFWHDVLDLVHGVRGAVRGVG
jgi:type IV secretory pathway VirB2 component (pilin)